MTRKRIYPLLLILIALFITFQPYSVVWADVSDNARLYDNAGLLSNSEADKINEKLNSLSQKYDCDIMLVTVNGLDSYSDRDSYIQGFSNDYNVSDDYVILLVNMDAEHNGSDRGMSISANGACCKKIKNNTCERMYKSLRNEMSNGNYYSAFLNYANQADRYLSKYSRLFVTFTPLELLTTLAVSLLLAFIIVLIMILNSGGKDTTSVGTYLNTENSRILVRRDQYIRTSVTKVKKPTENNNHSGGSSHHSSGGGSF